MRMMLKIMIPTEAGNLTIKDGSLPKVIEAAMGAGSVSRTVAGS